MSSVPGEALFGIKMGLASSPWAGHCHLEDPAVQGSSLLGYVWASGGSAGQLPPSPDETALNQPHRIIHVRKLLLEGLRSTRPNIMAFNLM